MVFLNVIELDPDNSNCQEKLKLLRVARVSSYWGFEQKTKKHLIEEVICFIRQFLAL